MTRQHRKMIRAQWENLTQDERDLVNLRGLLSTWKIKAMSQHSNNVKGAQRITETLERMIALVQERIDKLNPIAQADRNIDMLDAMAREDSRIK